MRVLVVALTVAACAVLPACAPSVPLQRAQIGSLSKEATPSDVERVLSGATMVAQTEFVVDEKSYLARHYRLLTGSRQEMSMVCTPNCIPIFVTVPVTSEYVVIQRMPSRQLHAWGTLEELSKDSDSTISSIMPVVKARFDEAKKKQ